MNTFGHLFRVTTWGESHGKAIGATIDGCPPNVNIDENFIQNFLDRRKPGQSKFTTQRKEDDKIEILSGVFEGKTTGSPLQLIILNKDQKSKDYSEIANSFRPGHADITYYQKYGNRDYRGGGRSSARETAARVAAGGVAKLCIKKLIPNLQIFGHLIQIGTKHINRSKIDFSEIRKNPFFSADKNIVEEWSNYLEKIRKSGNSVGAVIEIIAQGVPAGLGAPIYGKLDSDLAMAMMSINAVKGFEIGAGMKAAELTGSDNADEIYLEDGQPRYTSNNSGGVLGGISTGQDLIIRFAVKPTSSILSTKRSISKDGKEIDLITKGRHDPCVGIRAVPVGEAMMACTILDHFLLHRGSIGKNQGDFVGN